MHIWQELAELLPPELTVKASRSEDAEIGVDGMFAAFRVFDSPWIVRPATVAAIIDLNGRSERPLIVTFVRSTAAARAALREAGISYAGKDGHVFLRAPGVLVERGERLATGDAVPEPRLPDDVRNPFAGKASRIPRTLLLHDGEGLTPTMLAAAVDLSVTVVSRVLRALYEDGFVERSSPPDDRRRRWYVVRRPRRLLDRWASTPAGRPQRQHLWDLGAQSADAAIALIGEARSDLPSEGWALGGLAGAASVRRVVEPAELLVWASQDAVGELRQTLLPTEADRRRPGVLRIAEAPDPWTLRLAGERDGLPVVDDVQLYLDCLREGERGLDAAEAVAAEAGW